MGVLVRPAFVHEGVARSLVHRLKYDASPTVSRVLAAAMVPLLPVDAAALVPVPRVTARRWRYGVDPARELATAMAGRSGLPVVHALRPAVWVARRAGPRGRLRGQPRFAAVRSAPGASVLVDDVVTTGATLATAAGVLGVRRAVVATAAPRG
jgi:predicted amidophosphoribosyltransferase